MGIFNRKQDRNRQEATTIDVTDDTIAQAASALGAVEAAIGTTNDKIYPALRALTAASGVQAWDSHDLVTMRPEVVSNVIDRPWRWLAAVAAEAHARGDHALPPRAYLFMLWWTERWNDARAAAQRDRQPHHLQLQSDTLLGPTPDDARSQITAAAIASLNRLPPDHVVAPHAAEQVLAGPLLRAAVNT